MIPTVGLRECNHVCQCSKCRSYTDEKSEAYLDGSPEFQDLRAKYGDPIGEGWSRIVFDRGDGWVVKFPKHTRGKDINRYEAHLYERFKDEGTHAKCYLEEVGAVPVIHMEAVQRLDFREMSANEKYDWLAKNAPWAYYLDSAQIGYNAEGTLVAYDYGS